jgi:sulfur dioxygenase
LGSDFYQLFESQSSTYTYLLCDPKTREAVLIDPVKEMVERDLKLVEELGAHLKYVIDTHVHADHVTAAGELRKRTSAQTAIGWKSGVDCADFLLKDGEEIFFGKTAIRALSTPGHTDGCTSLLVGDRVFTGDALLIRGTGRTDFQEGSSTRLYQSITKTLFALPESTLVYPAHDYRGQTHSTIGLEKRFNPRVGGGKSEAEFVRILSELKLPPPQKIAEAVPANRECGLAQAS